MAAKLLLADGGHVLLTTGARLLLIDPADTAVNATATEVVAPTTVTSTLTAATGAASTATTSGTTSTSTASDG